MSKERLEEIKTQLDRFMTSANKPVLFREDAEWIINYAKEQAEQNQKYEGVINHLKNVHRKKINELVQQNKRYREALEFYAEGNHYYAEGYPDTRLRTVDYGEVAQEALEGEE